MKVSHKLQLATVATLLIGLTAPLAPALAQNYEEQEVNESEYIAVAAPFGGNKYNLLIVRQIPGKAQCWSESGSNPVVVEPLLLKMADFTGICDRKTDSNGYAIRIDGEDYGKEYLLSVVERNGDLLLVGTPSLGSTQKEIVVGKTNGVKAGAYLKINLEPGWQFTRRTYQGKVLGLVYLSGDSTAFGTPAGPPAAFRDITRDVYRNEIEQAVALGFVSGFEDKTFRPKESLTREQLVSLVLDALSKIPNANITVPTQVSSSPYPDVPTSRWSAAKIEWAKQNNIVTGYKDGTFKPANPVTRAELMAILKKAAEYANTKLGKSAQLTTQGTPFTFSDTTGNWAASTISLMSSYCKVASPVNEKGDAFEPNSPALRNYAAAATLRTLNCVKGTTTQ